MYGFNLLIYVCMNMPLFVWTVGSEMVMVDDVSFPTEIITNTNNKPLALMGHGELISDWIII